MSLTLDWSQIEPALSGVDLLEEMAAGFKAYSAGDCVVPPVGELLFEEPRGEVHIKYGYVRGGEHYVVKIASGFPGNPQLGFPVGAGLMLLFQQKTGAIARVLLDEGHLTNERTAAAGALASRTLAAPNVRCIGIVGAGVQARMQAAYHARVFQEAEFVIWGRDEERRSECVAALQDQGLRVSAADSLEALASKCELIVTTTSATAPLLRAEWIKPGTHITAVGSDTPEKQELGTSLMALADRVVCDSLDQCRLRGEVAQALQSGEITEDGVVELGAVLSGSAPGRSGPLEVSVCDLTGVAVQDLHIAEAVHRAHL